MPLKKDQIIIRITPSLKRKIESTAKKQKKTVSDFIRDIVSLYVDKDLAYEEYMVALNEYHELIAQRDNLLDIIFDTEDKNKTDEKLKELGYVTQRLHERQRIIKEYLDNQT